MVSMFFPVVICVTETTPSHLLHRVAVRFADDEVVQRDILSVGTDTSDRAVLTSHVRHVLYDAVSNPLPPS